MRKYFYAVGILFLSVSLSGQTLLDAYLISSQKVNGTARAAAMGNAFGALGGDFTSLSINPAGIAVYRSSEFVITPTARFNNSDLSFDGNTFSESDYSHGVNNVGYIGNIKTGLSSGSGLVSINLGVGMNTILNLNQSSFGSVNQSASSFLDGIVGWANSEALSNSYISKTIGEINYEDWPAKLAYNTFLMDPTDDDGVYTSILYDDEKVDQEMNYSYSGGIKEYVFSCGLNFSHKFYIGASVGIQDVDITKNKEYTEYLEDNNSFTYYEYNFIDGTGYNLKVGAIYKPVSFIRLGAAFHTPTYYKLNDDMKLSMKSRLRETHTSSGISLYNYNLNSPYKLILSGAVVLNKFAAISIDGEFVDYSQMEYNYNDLNNDINDSFGNTFNLRMGTEFKIMPTLSARAGIEHYENPFASDFSLSEASIKDDNFIWSLGLGYRNKRFFADFAFRNSKNTYSFYNPQPNFESLEVKNKNNQILLTIGFKF